MRVLQLRGQADLAAESLAAHRCRQLGRQHLDHDLPLEPELFGQEHPAHRPATELPLDAIAALEGRRQLGRHVRATARDHRRGRRRDHILRQAIEELVG